MGFSPVTSGLFGLNSQVSLGAFQVSTIGDGSTTTYNNTPFTITYNPLSAGGDNFPNSPITIGGVLNGTVNGNQSNLVATFNSINSPVFQTTDGTFLSSISVAEQPARPGPVHLGRRPHVDPGVGDHHRLLAAPARGHRRQQHDP